MKGVDVVVLIVHRDGKILVEKRKLTKKTDPGKVVIPGGHIERKETFEQACKRELEEELGLDCNKFEFLIKLIHRTEIEDQIVHYYLCKDWKGEPKCKEAERIFWISPEQTNVLDLEVDRKAAQEFFKTL